MKIVKIKYIDSNIINEQTNEIAKPEIIEAVGFLLPKTGDYETIAREVIGEEYRGQLAIPDISILEMHELDNQKC